MKEIIGYVLIATPFLFMWLGVPALLKNEYDTYWDGFKITSCAILFTGFVGGVVSLGVYLISGSW